MKEKQCKRCGKIKPINDFYEKQSMCKSCCVLKSKEYYKQHINDVEYTTKRKIAKHDYDMRRKKSKEGWYSKAYNNMNQRNKRKFGEILPFSKTEFIQWIENNYKECFDYLFQKYIDSGCDKYLAPSIDRIDDYKSYYFENMQLLTWKQNDAKGTIGTKNKISCAEVGKKYCSKPVVQYDDNMNELARFNSTHEVERLTGFNSSLIAKACRERFKSKGYSVLQYKQKTRQ